MKLEEMIEQGRNIKDNDENYYYWIDTVEQYLDGLPNKSYISKAMESINNCKALGYSTIRRKESVNRIISILKRVYDNEQEKFLQENLSTPLLSIFEDTRMSIVKNEFEAAVQFRNEGRYEQAITEACKSIESMMKEVCNHCGITYTNKDSYCNLAKLLESNNILPINDMVLGHQRLRNSASAHGADACTYEPTKEDAVFEINRGAALLIYLYEKSGM